MKRLSVADVVEKNKVASSIPYLILADIEVVDQNTGVVIDTVRIARNSENVTYMGNVYSANHFDVGTKQEHGEVKNLIMTARDYRRALQAYLQEYDGMVGSHVTIYMVNAGALDAPAEIAEEFDVIIGSASDYQVSLTLGARNLLGMTVPKRNQLRDYCAWKYKSDECGYSGGLPTCDLTLNGDNGCAAHNNTKNFGGFPGIKSRY